MPRYPAEKWKDRGVLRSSSNFPFPLEPRLQGGGDRLGPAPGATSWMLRLPCGHRAMGNPCLSQRLTLELKQLTLH